VQHEQGAQVQEQTYKVQQVVRTRQLHRYHQSSWEASSDWLCCTGEPPAELRHGPYRSRQEGA